MLRLLFTTEDNSKQLTVITDGLDSQLNVFVTENVVGAIEYYKSIGIVIEAGYTYNIGKIKEWCYDAFIKLIAYPEGFGEEAVVLTDIKEEYVYKLTTDEPTLNFTGEGGQDMCVVTSSKQLMKNDKPEGAEEGVPVTFATSSAGFTVNTDGQVVAAVNPTDQERDGIVTVTQAESGKTIEIQLVQAGSVVTYEYTCTVDPTELTFAQAGETKVFGVTATKQKKVNGSDSGAPSAVTYTTTVQGEGFTKGSSEYSVVAAANTGAQRTGTAVVTTTEGNKTATVTLTQLAGA